MAIRSIVLTLPLLAIALPLGAQVARQPVVQSIATPILSVGNLKFRDLDRSGTLDPYEDWRLPSAARAADLVTRMTLEEKAGAAVHGTAPSGGGPMGGGRTYDSTAAIAQVMQRHVNSVITRLSIPPADFAAQNNLLQAIGERSRLGIPLTISTDPRSHFQVIAGASVATSGFSQWPETLGLGALDDAALVKRFASIVRQEYRAVGIQMALSPQADLGTEPRWSRITVTFGESPTRVGAMVAAYVQGMQGSNTGLTRDGVATVVKHWVGYGASVDGFDGHNHYGRFARFPGNRFSDHVTPFLGAIASNVVGVMPTYDILNGLSIDGSLSITRLNEAVARIMVVKFDLGLFENPYVDPAQAATIVGNAQYRNEGLAAQAKAVVVLENSRGARMLPAAGAKLFLHGVDSAVARARGYTVVSNARDADVAVVRLAAPFQTLHPTFFFGSFQHEGDLDYKDTDSTLTLLKATAATVPTIVVVYLDRPAILTAIQPLAKTLIGEFGVSDGALFDVLTGKVRPTGRLPFELPRSMEAVRAQKVDVPHDSPSPLYPFGYRARL